VSEIGDKTFLIAAILASRQPRLTVFAGAFASLVIMSILSAAMGRVIGLVPKEWTQFAVRPLLLAGFCDRAQSATLVLTSCRLTGCTAA
jgi:putative Ca2+/H+ antiporter (TMEM165/GDT1 family)